MTTMAAADATLARFNRKSPRDAYKQVCEELGIHYQRDIYNKLPEVPNAWHRIRTLELDGSLLGPKGCMSLLPIILVSTTLRKITLANCGLSDEFVIELCQILQGHQSVRAVDISNNELVSIFCASSIISLMKNNSNMIAFETFGTHLGDNVANIISQLSLRNQNRVATYYVDNYFKLKDLFGYLDESGEGWVLLKSLVMNCPYPVLQEQFVERIGMKKPRKRSDGCISVNTFMSLVYMNYKTEGEILDHSNKTIDEPYVFMVANWKQILSAVERYNEDAAQQVVLPDDLHRIRLKDFLLTNEDADAIISSAVSLQEQENTAAAAASSSTGIGATSATETELPISSLVLLQASKSGFAFPPSTRPVYQFFKERDAAYIPEMMRNGSRLFSMGSLPIGGQSAGGSGRNSVIGGEGEVDPEDPPHTWNMPPSVLKLVVEYFNQVYTKLPKKKESTVPESPRTKKDKAMEKSAIPIESLLSVTFETDFETLLPAKLANFYAYYSIPTADSTITLQEMVNVLDELYVQITVDKVLSNDVIEAIENPFAVAEYADFLAEHLLGRDSIELYRHITGEEAEHRTAELIIDLSGRWAPPSFERRQKCGACVESTREKRGTNQPTNQQEGRVGLNRLTSLTSAEKKQRRKCNPHLTLVMPSACLFFIFTTSSFHVHLVSSLPCLLYSFLLRPIATHAQREEISVTAHNPSSPFPPVLGKGHMERTHNRGSGETSLVVFIRQGGDRAERRERLAAARFSFAPVQAEPNEEEEIAQRRTSDILIMEGNNSHWRRRPVGVKGSRKHNNISYKEPSCVSVHILLFVLRKSVATGVQEFPGPSSAGPPSKTHPSGSSSYAGDTPLPRQPRGEKGGGSVSPSKGVPPFKLPHIDRLHYYDSAAKEVQPWPKKKVWPEAQLPEEPFRPPNPATGMVKKIKKSIENLKKVIPEEKAYEEEETFQDYSLDHATNGGFTAKKKRSLLSNQVNEQGNVVRAPATEMQKKWVPPENTGGSSREGPIRDGNVVAHSVCTDFSKRSTRDINDMSTFERAQLWKYMHYRGDGVTFEEAAQTMKRETMARVVLCSYPTASRNECERCNPTPASTGSRKNPLVYLESETEPRCGVRPGLEHLAPLDKPRVHVNPNDPNGEKDYKVVESKYIINPTRAEALEQEAKDRQQRQQRSAQHVTEYLEARKKEEAERSKNRRPLPVLSSCEWLRTHPETSIRHYTSLEAPLGP
eukprot:gene8042-5595_t